VAAATLLSAWLLFTAQPSVAETLAVASQEAQTQNTDDASAPRPQEPSAAQEGVRQDKGDSNEDRDAQAEPPQHFTATAYALRGRTASGKPVRRGLIAADRRVLPIGTRVRLEAGSYSGEYVVADTGGAVRGRKIDIWMPSNGEAMRFGRRPVKLTVLTRVRPRAAARGRAR
jgi:3D (Asp-Asp-Asp) domain-containing protein